VDSKKKGKYPFHGQRLSNHLAGEIGEPSPVSAELELQRYTGHHTHGKVDPENAAPEPGTFMVSFVVRLQTGHLEPHDEKRQPHRQLWEKVVEADGKRKLNSMPKQSIVHVGYPNASQPGSRLWKRAIYA
jgi:hypothetical protein